MSVFISRDPTSAYFHSNVLIPSTDSIRTEHLVAQLDDTKTTTNIGRPKVSSAKCCVFCSSSLSLFSCCLSSVTTIVLATGSRCGTTKGKIFFIAVFSCYFSSSLAPSLSFFSVYKSMAAGGWQRYGPIHRLKEPLEKKWRSAATSSVF